MEKNYEVSVGKILLAILMWVMGLFAILLAWSDVIFGVDESEIMDLNVITSEEVEPGDAYMFVDYVVDYYCYTGTEDETDIEDKTYLVPVDDKYISIKLSGSDMRAMDRNLEKINAFYDNGDTDFDALYESLEVIEVRGEIINLGGTTKEFFDEYMELLEYSPEEVEELFLPYIFIVNEVGDGTSDASLGLTILGVAVIALGIFFFCKRKKVEVRDSGKIM